MRYRLLETVRAYAAEKLLEAGEESLVRDRHRAHFLAWVESIAPELTYLDPRGDAARGQHNLRGAPVVRTAGTVGPGRAAGQHDEPCWIGHVREGAAG